MLQPGLQADYRATEHRLSFMKVLYEPENLKEALSGIYEALMKKINLQMWFKFWKKRVKEIQSPV